MRSVLVILVAACFGCAGNDQTLPPAFHGTFHDDAVDAVDLRINDGGTFQWQIYGCDFGATVEGVWSRNGDRVVLRSADGAALQWVHSGSFKFQIDHVEIAAFADHLDAVGRSETDAVVFQQSWAAGAVCAACGGDRGPSGQCQCDDPFVDPNCR